MLHNTLQKHGITYLQEIVIEWYYTTTNFIYYYMLHNVIMYYIIAHHNKGLIVYSAEYRVLTTTSKQESYEFVEADLLKKLMVLN